MDAENTTQFKADDVRILRETLVGVMKKAPPQIQARCHDALLRFAKSVSEYCKCEERVFVEHEQKFACLNCGRRHIKKEGQPLEVLK